jgi:RNA polymerase sigma-70 factor (ECF subfamily)
MQTSTGLLEQVRDLTNRDAWGRLVTLYTPYLFGWLRRRLVPAQDADDLVQEVLRVVAVELPHFHHNHQVGAFRCWLRTILAHRLRDHRRRESTRSGVHGSNLLEALADQLEDDGSGVAVAWDREHDQQIVRRMLALIEADFQPVTWRAFWLVVVEGNEPDAVAGKLNISVDSVYTAKSRVLKRLREQAGNFLDR